MATQLVRKMELKLVEPERPNLLDTLPALIIAADDILRLLQVCHYKLLDTVSITPVVKEVRKRLEGIPIAGHTGEDIKSQEQVAESIKVFTRESLEILDSENVITESSMKRVLSEWMPFVHALFYTSLALLLKTDIFELDRPLVNALLQRWLPFTARLWLFFSKSPEMAQDVFPSESDFDWLEVSWDLICEANVANNRDSDPEMAIFILARLLKLFLPWSDAQTVNVRVFEHDGFDIRRNPEFTHLLRRGLLEVDSAVRKQALYILKQVVKFCTFYLQPPLIDEPQLEEDVDLLFIWEAKDRAAWGEIWRKFCLIYESVHETQVHVVEPLLPLLKSLVEEPSDQVKSLPFEWWTVIVQRALSGDSASVRKRVTEAVLSIEPSRAPKLARSDEFLRKTLLRALDSTSLYANSEAASQVSLFGMKVAQFYAKLLKLKHLSVLAFLESIKENIRSATPALFLIQALLQLELPPSLGAKEVSLLKEFSRNNALFHNIKARRLVRWQLLQAFLRLADTSVLAFDEIAGALTDFLGEKSEQLTIDSVEYCQVSDWLKVKFGEDYVQGNICLAVQQYFSSAPVEMVSVALVQRRCDELATMLIFTLAKEGGFAQSVRPLYQQMALLAGADTSVEYVIAGMALFLTLNSTIRAVSKGQADLMASLDVSARLYEWIAVLEDLLLKTPGKLPDLASIRILLRGMRLMFEKAQEQPDALVAYLDILLYQMVDLLAVFGHAQSGDEAESFELQLQKVISFSLMDMGFVHLEAVSSFHLGFVDQAVLRGVFATELEKPPAMSSLQAEDWNGLVAAFDESRWSLVATMARFSIHSAEMHSLVDVATVFEQCIDALEAASYGSVLAIFDCMRILVAIPPFENAMSKADDQSFNANEEEEEESHSPLLQPTIGLKAIEDSVAVSKRIIEETANTPAWYYLYLESFIDYFFQPALLTRLDVAGDCDSLAAHVLSDLLDIGVNRKNIVARLSKNLHAIWSTLYARASLWALQPLFMQLLLYGPVRDDTEDRLAYALTRDNVNDTDAAEKALMIESASVGSDYLVRVHMNSILLHLDPQSTEDHAFALSVVDDLLDLALK